MKSIKSIKTKDTNTSNTSNQVNQSIKTVSKTNSIPSSKSNLPWIEKHRPYKLTGVKIDEHIKTQIMQMIKSHDVPNIILEGPPGVGKTSTIKCVAREIYGKYYSYMVMELNASDDRGIKIQEPIESFKKAYVHINDEDKDKIPSFKMIILDEADNMTDKAKHIISGFIKSSVSLLRFAFTCNSKNNIIPSIQSGCHNIQYPPLHDDIIKDRLKEICVSEGIINDSLNKKQLRTVLNGIDAIAQISNGDMRFSINILQLTYDRFNEITVDNVFTIQDKPHPEKSKDIIMCCINGDLGEAIKKITDMKLSGYSGTDITMGLRLALRLDICDDIPEPIKIELWKCISYTSYNISKGLDSSQLQITACVADMYKTTKKFRSIKN